MLPGRVVIWSWTQRSSGRLGQGGDVEAKLLAELAGEGVGDLFVGVDDTDGYRVLVAAWALAVDQRDLAVVEDEAAGADGEGACWGGPGGRCGGHWPGGWRPRARAAALLAASHPAGLPQSK